MKKTVSLLSIAGISLILYSCSDTYEPVEIPYTEALPATLTVDPDVEYQTVRGFGVMETSWQQSPLSDDEVETLYGNEFNQLGCNILRVRIAPKENFESADSRWGRIIPVIHKAKSMGATILATPWTPPASMKTSGNIVGGQLMDYEAYAMYLCEYLSYMKENDADIDVISIQNEPDFEVTYEGCIWSGLQQARFFKEWGSYIKSRHPEVKLMTGESFQYRHEATDPILEDEIACKAIDIVGGHIYGGGNNPYDLAVSKEKEYWMTEHLLNDAWEKSAPYSVIGDIKTETLELAKELNTAMESGFNAYIYWYGRRYYGMLGDGLAESEMSKPTARGYIYAQFAKNITGKTRVKTITSKNVSASLSVTAYKNQSGDISLMFVNPTSSEIKDLNIKLPFVPSSCQCVISTVGNNPFPENTDGYLMESSIDLSIPISIQANSIVTINAKK